MPIAMQLAQGIVGRAMRAMIELLPSTSLAPHVGCSFDLWVSDAEPTEELQQEVRTILESCGLGW